MHLKDIYVSQLMPWTEKIDFLSSLRHAHDGVMHHLTTDRYYCIQLSNYSKIVKLISNTHFRNVLES